VTQELKGQVAIHGLDPQGKPRKLYRQGVSDNQYLSAMTVDGRHRPSASMLQ
jgi:hypothetical protein